MKLEVVRYVVDTIIKPSLKRRQDPRREVFAHIYGGPKDEAANPGEGWTFGELCKRFVAMKLKHSGKRSYQEYGSAFRRKEFDGIANKLAASVTPSDIATIRDGITNSTSAKRSLTVLRYISEMFRWAPGEPVSAVPKGYNPTVGLNLPVPLVKDNNGSQLRYLMEDEIPLVLRAIAATEMDFGIRMALLFILATGQRRGAVVQAELDQLLISKDCGPHWHCPARIMKARQDHIFPFTPVVQRIVDAARRHAQRLDSIWLFPSERRAYRGQARDTHINEGALNAVLSRMLAPDSAVSPPNKRASKKQRQYTVQGEMDRLGVKDWDTHDSRRTMTTLLMPHGVQEWHVSLLLAHSIGGTDHSRSPTTRKHYNLYRYYAEKLAAAERWGAVVEKCGLTAEYLDTVEAVELASWNRRMAKRKLAAERHAKRAQKEAAKAETEAAAAA